MIIQRRGFVNSGYNDKFSFSPDQDGKGGNVGDDAEDKYYPEYEAGREYRISFYDQIYVREQVKI